MKKQTWIEHIIETSGLTPPSKGGNAETWHSFVREHKTNCKLCAERIKTRKANNYAKERNQCMKDLGLVSYRTESGALRWE